MTRYLSPAFELAGFALVAAAAFLVDWRLGMAVAGALLVVLGWALDRPRAVE